ncbi:MAG TPA: ABC transporter substrate-binding protein [Polyangiaceae bacterium]|jgi:polar amino acid transport system substrate-binding protein|nr:ABC transporter substrate-binding protein [Polyangiaceae bacterium]
MRLKRGVLVVAVGLLMTGCAEEGSPTSSGAGSQEQGCDVSNPPVLEEGVLTVATDRPAYPPWFEGSPKHYTGFEGDVATEISERLGLSIKWVEEPFNKSYSPGPKDYDFDINQISVTPEREQAVDFSDSYFDNTQGVLVMKGSSLSNATSLDDLKDAQLGAQVGTTSLSFINSTVQPAKEPKIFDTTNDAKSALEGGQIDGLVTDLVTTVYLRDFEIDGSTVVGQYPTNEPFGMLFEKGNPLRDCVNQVLADMKDDGTLEQLQEKWLKDYLTVPTLEG